MGYKGGSLTFTTDCAILGALFTLAAGCAKNLPPSPNAEITECHRPAEIATDGVREFTLSFDHDDALEMPAAPRAGDRIDITAHLVFDNPHNTPGDSLGLIVGYRRVINSKADWSIPPCEMPHRCEWRLGGRQVTVDGAITADFEGSPTVETEPGDYELRYYLVRENSLTQTLPSVIYIGNGRMTVQ